ncbi:MAG: glycine cleavage system protein GcvH [Thermoguttaceae bacterium]|nr:glycine cleavage system protein GcvH [Thermoguttaceae bacterium]MDW8038023.1 glycine cleavage system protein GcvH [Thermoguttaceae bacterium]
MSTFLYPEELRYTKTHEWVRVERDSAGQLVAVVGITAFAIDALKDLVHVELPPVGRSFQAGQEAAEIESVKAVSPIYCPVAGEVVAVNTQLENQLDRLAEDPYQQGWFFKVRITDPAGLDNLLDAAAYQKHCESESH